MLAYGTGTMAAVNGFVSGLPGTGIYTNYGKESYRDKYGMGTGSILKKSDLKSKFNNNYNIFLINWK